MKISVGELRAAADLLLRRLEKRGYSDVEVSVDYYWNIPKEQKYDRGEEPKELDVGQLSEDWQKLQEMVRGEAEPVVYALVWLAAILRYVGEEVGD